jgi:hypothetical protein
VLNLSLDHFSFCYNVINYYYLLVTTYFFKPINRLWRWDMTINIFNVWVKCNLIIVTESGNVQSMDKNDNHIRAVFFIFPD